MRVVRRSAGPWRTRRQPAGPSMRSLRSCTRRRDQAVLDCSRRRGPSRERVRRLPRRGARLRSAVSHDIDPSRGCQPVSAQHTETTRTHPDAADSRPTGVPDEPERVQGSDPLDAESADAVVRSTVGAPVPKLEAVRRDVLDQVGGRGLLSMKRGRFVNRVGTPPGRLFRPVVGAAARPKEGAARKQPAAVPLLRRSGGRIGLIGSKLA
jgi:hypothetical protein